MTPIKTTATNWTRLLMNNLEKGNLGACCFMLSYPPHPINIQTQESGVEIPAKTNQLAEILTLKNQPYSCS
jgi:hypothetical protein